MNKWEGCLMRPVNWGILINVLAVLGSSSAISAPLPDVPLVQSIPRQLKGNLETKGEIPDLGPIPRPDTPVNPSQPVLDPRCQDLTEEQRRTTPGCF